jgi:hypothetical protein
MERTGVENQSQLRAAINAAVRANVSLYTVDIRGLQALPPGGNATTASLRGTSAYSGRAVQSQLDSNFASQETLSTLAADTGGKTFLDSNDFSKPFAKVQQDTASYYVLGYRSANKAMDGRYRKISVRVNRKDVKLDFRAGYYAPRDFVHFTKDDREKQLQDEIMSDFPTTDLPVYMATGYFRMQDDRFYVPVSLVVPGSAIPAMQAESSKATLDFIGIVREASSKFPVGNVRDTVKIPLTATPGAARKNVQYNTGFMLPPGSYHLKFVVRENQNGRLGAFEMDFVVPNLKKLPLKMSSILLSSQRGTPGKFKQNPLIKDGAELVPNVAHVFSNDQKLTFYFEVYDPAKATAAQGEPEKKDGIRLLGGLAARVRRLVARVHGLFPFVRKAAPRMVVRLIVLHTSIAPAAPGTARPSSNRVTFRYPLPKPGDSAGSHNRGLRPRPEWCGLSGLEHLAANDGIRAAGEIG